MAVLPRWCGGGRADWGGGARDADAAEPGCGWCSADTLARWALSGWGVGAFAIGDAVSRLISRCGCGGCAAASADRLARMGSRDRAGYAITTLNRLV